MTLRRSILILASTGMLGWSCTASAQTILNPGDIFILGARSTAADGFAFVTWVDLAAGTQIGFTDNSYKGSGSWLGSENFATWQATSFVAAGTVIVATDSGTNPESYDLHGAISGSTGRMSGISGSGDQIFVYQKTTGTVDITTPMSGTSTTEAFKSGYQLLFGFNFANSGFTTTGPADSNKSFLPDASSGAGSLGGGTSFSSTAVDTQYTGARSGLTIEQFKTAVLDSANWSTVAGSGGTLSSTDFAVVPEPGAGIALIGGIGMLVGANRFRRSLRRA